MEYLAQPTFVKGIVRDNWYVLVDGLPHEVVQTGRTTVPPVAYGLLNFIDEEVIIEGIIDDKIIYANAVHVASRYNPGPPPIIHRMGTTLHPLAGRRAINWRNKWSLTHSIEPPLEESPPWNAPITRSAANLQRIIDFLDVENTARYEPRQGWTCAAIFVSDVTRMMHCEICLDPAGERKAYNRAANDMIDYIMTVSLIEHGWFPVDSAEQAQQRANEGFPVIALKIDPNIIGHLAVVVPGTLNEGGFPLIAQAGLRCFNAGRWTEPGIEYISHA
jgi:hypothetical protein